MHIKKGDTVVVISGSNKGTTGKVLRVLPKSQRVVIEGVNKMKKHQRPSQNNPDGGIVEFEAPINVSNVAILDPKAKTATKVGYKIVNDKKVRYAKKSGELLDK